MDTDKIQEKKIAWKKIIPLALVFTAIIGMAIFFRKNPGYMETIQTLSSNNWWLTVFVVLGAVLDSINPCAFSVLLLTIAFLFSMGRERSHIVKTGGVYIAGIYVMYFLIGVSILKAIQLFNIPHFFTRFFAIVMIALGLVEIIKEFFPKFPIRLGIPHSAHPYIARLIEKGSVPTAFILGAFVGLVEFPCTGGPYLAISFLLGSKTTYLKGLWYLILYNFIFILPLIVILFIASEKSILEKAQEWKNKNAKSIAFWSAIAVVILGALILFIQKF